MSSPFAHASAARSADIRSLKLTNAHLRHRNRFGKLRTHDALRVNHLDFATWTIERKDVGLTPGNDLMTRVRMVCSVADAGNEERNNDIWSQMSAGTRAPRAIRTHHRLIFWRLEALLFGMPSQNFARDRIVVPKVSVLDILF
jgi:hypothetical protein